VFANSTELDILLHATNRWGHSLLTYVSHYDKSLTAAHGLLLEMEVSAHAGDDLAVRECLRRSLGSTASAAVSKDVLARIGHKQTAAGKYCLLLRILSVTFVLRIVFFILDLTTDALLLHDYLLQWQKEVVREDKTASILFPGQVVAPTNPCHEVHTVQATGRSSDQVLSYYDRATQNITLGCYSGAIDGQTRFSVTVAILTLPFILYFFELLRFRVFSLWLERRTLDAVNSRPFQIVIGLGKLVANTLLLLLWAPVAFFRQFWFRYKFESSESEDRVETHR